MPHLNRLQPDAALAIEATGDTSQVGAVSAIEPLLVPADVAGPLCGVSEATWWRLHAAAKVPAP